jgi:hypothetical protein
MYCNVHSYASARSTIGRMFIIRYWATRYLVNSQLLTELLGVWTFSIVWYSREHDVSETGYVSVLS